MLTEGLDGCAGLRHLHEAVDALLHAGAAARTEDEKRQMMCVGILDRTGHLLADRTGHGAHEEAAVEDDRHEADAFDGADRGDDGLGKTGLLLLLLDLLLIAREAERIIRADVAVQLFEAARIEDQLETIVATEWCILSAGRTNEVVFLPSATERTASAAPAGDEARRDHHSRKTPTAALLSIRLCICFGLGLLCLLGTRALSGERPGKVNTGVSDHILPRLLLERTVLIQLINLLDRRLHGPPPVNLLFRTARFSD